MAQAARAYSGSAPQRQPERQPQRLPVFRVLDGIPNPASVIGPASLLRNLAVAAMVVVLTLVAVSVCRVALTTATVSETMRYEQIREDIYATRAIGVELEVQHSLASSPERIQTLATMYGMVPSAKIKTVAAADMPSDAAADAQAGEPTGNLQPGAGE